jgi:hypothetical protein
MAEHIGNLFECRTSPDHLCRDGVPKNVRAQTGRLDANPPQRTLRDCSDRRGSQWTTGWPRTQEDHTMLAMVTPTAKIGSERLANLMRQGEPALASGFAGANQQASPGPVNVVESQGGDFSGAQPEASKK